MNIRALSLLFVVVSGCAASTMPPELGSQVISKREKTSQLSPEVERRSEEMYHYLLGEWSIKNDDLPGAIKNFEKASELSAKPSPQLLIKLAELELRSGNLKKASLESSKALALAPNNGKALVLHAGILEALKKTEEAINYYKQAITTNPNLIDPYIFLAGVYLRDGRNKEAISVLSGYVDKHPDELVTQLYLGKALEQDGDLKNARRSFQKAYESRPENEQLAFEYIRVLIKLERYDDAKEVCGDILEKNPDHQLARKILGQLLMGEQKFDEALTHFKILESSEDDATDTRFKIALIQIERRKFEEAINELHLVLAANPSFSQARYALGTALAGLGNFQDGAEELSRIGKSDELYVRAQTYASLLYRQMGDLKGAEKAIRKTFQAGEPNESTRIYLISLLKESGKVEDAARELDDLVQANPTNERLRFEQVVLYDEIGRKKEALHLAEEILKGHPDYEEVLNYVAYALASKKKDLERAEQLAKKAIAKRPEEPYFIDTLGWVYFQQGKFVEALNLLQTAAEKAVGDPVILEHYGVALEKNGQSKDAYSIYEKAVAIPKKKFDKDAQEALDRMKQKLEKK